MAGPHRVENTIAAGAPLDSAKAALILVHGRGATAESMLPLAEAFGRDDVAYLAPQATGNTWYPLQLPGADRGERAVALLGARGARRRWSSDSATQGFPPERIGAPRLLAGRLPRDANSRRATPAATASSSGSPAG